MAQHLKSTETINKTLYLVTSNKKGLPTLPDSIANDIFVLNSSKNSESNLNVKQINTSTELVSLIDKEPYNRICILPADKNIFTAANLAKINNTPSTTELKCKGRLWGTYKTCGWILNSSTLVNLIKQGLEVDNSLLHRIGYLVHNDHISSQSIEIELDATPQTSKGNLVKRISFSLFWFFIAPFKKSMQSSGKESAYFRGVFAWLMLVLMFIMPIMSWTAGYSGDEEKHYDHAKYVYNYFATMGKDSTALNPGNNNLLQYYGQSFDNVSYILIKWFKVKNPMEFRHVLNSLTGWGTILFTGLLAALLAGWRTGIMAALLLFFSPRFLGHSLNNPADIPFAMGCAIALYYIVRFNRSFPYIHLRTVLLLGVGLGVAISIRIGGLLFVAMTILFAGVNFLAQHGVKGLFEKNLRPVLMRLIVFVGFAALLGYFLGILLWPYALTNPIAHPLEALAKMTNISNSLRQVFEGEQIWSNSVPWYYTIKYIAISVPIVVFLGIALFIGLIQKVAQKVSGLNVFVLLFTFIFPIVYIIIKKSNVYGGWRHMNFIYPALIITAALGFTVLLDMVQKKWMKLGIWIVFAGFISLPSIHIIRNYPLHYVYFNEFVGGVKGAYGKYEMDYYYHSMRAGTLWILDNELNQGKYTKDSPMILASNHYRLTSYYTRNYDNVKVKYVRYYERGQEEWDYFVVVNSFISPYQLQKGYWPPKNTIHTIDVSGEPMCAILKRKNDNDLKAFRAQSRKNYSEALKYYDLVLKDDKNYDWAWLNLAKMYIEMNQFDNAIAAASQCLKTYDDYDHALFQLALGYLNKNKADYAKGTLQKLLNSNFNYRPAYYLMGVACYMKQEYTEALKYLQESIQRDPSFKPAYSVIGNIYQAQGNTELAQQYYQIAGGAQ